MQLLKRVKHILLSEKLPNKKVITAEDKVKDRKHVQLDNKLNLATIYIFCIIRNVFNVTFIQTLAWTQDHVLSMITTNINSGLWDLLHLYIEFKTCLAL